MLLINSMDNGDHDSRQSLHFGQHHHHSMKGRPVCFAHDWEESSQIMQCDSEAEVLSSHIQDA